MAWIWLKKIGTYLLVLVGLSILIFTIARIIPGDPARMALGPRTPEETVQKLKQEMNLDKPIYIQYVLWVKGGLHGDFGKSLMTRRLVSEDIREYLPATFEIVIISTFLMIFGGITLGIISAKFSNTWLDGVIRVISYLGIVSPSFVWAIIFLLIFGYLLPIFPVSGRLSMSITEPSFITGMFTIDALLSGSIDTFKDAFMHLVIPAVSLCLGGLAQAARITRSSMTGNMTKDYILAQNAYGVPEGVIFFKYLLKPSLIPTVSILALDIAALFGQAFLVELIFNFPGLSKYGIQAMLNKDLNAISAVVLILGCVFIIVNIIIEIIIAILDPRIRLMGRSV